MSTKDLLVYPSPTKQEIIRRAESGGFTQTSTLERLWWDYEFAAQLQRLDRAFVLKGGAAAQLFLNPSLQRGSRDIDLVTRLSKEQVTEYFSQLETKFDGSKIDVRPYAPKKPALELPLVTYEAYFDPITYKARFGPNLQQDYIKLEVLSVNADLPTTLIEQKETPVLTVRNVTCVSLGALCGDKLTTLASKTIGVLRDEQPKQLYDIDNMVFGNNLTDEDINQMVRTFDILAKVELKFRKRNETPMSVLRDIISTLDSFANADLALGDRNIRKVIRDFEGTYVSRKGTLSASGWSARSLRVRFLARMMQLGLQGKMGGAGLAKILARTKRLSNRLEESDEKLRGKLLTQAKDQRELKGKPLNRLFWEVARPSNIEDLDRMI